MRVSADHSRRAELPWSLQDISHVTGRRNGAVTWLPFLIVPHEVRLSRDGVLHFQWYRTDHTFKGARSALHSSRNVDSRLWKEFIALAGATDREIRAFANKWGPLRHKETQPQIERLSDWRKYARLALAIFQCSVALKQRRLGSIEDWNVVGSWLGADLTSQLQDGDDLARRYTLAQALNLWFSRAKASSLIAIQKEKLVIAPAVNSLFGIIGVQLAYQITGASQMLVCHHCHRSFTPARKPPTGVRTFCPACRRDKKPQLYAMRDLRARRQPRVQN